MQAFRIGVMLGVPVLLTGLAAATPDTTQVFAAGQPAKVAPAVATTEMARPQVLANAADTKRQLAQAPTSAVQTVDAVSTGVPNSLAPLGTEAVKSLDDGPTPEPLDPGATDQETDIKYGKLGMSLTPEQLDEMTSIPASAKRVSLMASICQALEHNQSLRVQKLQPEISHTSIESAESEFDTYLDASISQSTKHSSTLGPRLKERPDDYTREERKNASRNSDLGVSLGGRLPTGTDWSIGYTANRNFTNTTEHFYSSNASLNVTQNLLKGAGSKINCINVWTAQHNFVISLYQLQQVVINLVADVQVAYWDVYLALQTLSIRREAYEVAKEQRERTEEFVRVGKSPPLELLAAQAEESARINDIINAQADLKRKELTLLRLLNPEAFKMTWDTQVHPAQVPEFPTEEVRVKDRISLAHYYRPDLRQAELDLANGELQVVKTENGLLPALDFFTELDSAGSGDSLRVANKKVYDRNFPSWRVGLQFSYALQNRQASAAYRRATFNKQAAEEAIGNYCQIIEVDLRTAAIEIDRTKKLIDSTHVTRKLREEELAAEIEKYRVGRSTQLNVAQAQRDLTSAKLDEITAVVNHTKSYIGLYKAEGTTLKRLGITPVRITEASGVTPN